MRIASKLVRTSREWEPKSKYYIVPEGEKTEIQYFCGIRDNADELNIKSLIDIIPVENDEDEQGQSHPKEKIQNFNKDLQNGKFTFDKELDKVCFVVDRDPQNFKEEQFDEFKHECEKYGYKFYITNPAFEFFLLLHSDEIFKFDEKEMLKNERQGPRRGKRFLEIKLSEVFGCSKKNIDFEKFKPNIRKAINNEKQFCEELEELKNNLGSNVGKLLDSMME